MNASLSPSSEAPHTVLTLPPAPRTHVTVRGLSKAFAGSPLYTDFNLDLPRGQIVSIFGPTAAASRR